MSHPLKAVCTAALVASAFPATAMAEGFFLGSGVGSVGSFTNDALGDTHDRWQTASYQRSWFFENTPLVPLDAIEFRMRGQIVSPWTSKYQKGGDRPYASSLGMGLFGYKLINGFEARFGGEILMIGDQTGLPSLQSGFHDLTGYGGYDPNTRNDPHVANDWDGRLEIELAHSVNVAGPAILRPYVMAEAGAQAGWRAGGDIIMGDLVRHSPRVWTRDVVTGQPLTTYMHGGGWNVIAGIDIGRVHGSYLIPDGSDVEVRNDRVRARIGVQTQLDALSIFVGQTWLSEAFSGQDEAQRVGTLSIGLAF